MKRIKILNLAALALVPAALLTFTAGCSTSATPKDQVTSAASFQPGVPGGVMTETYQTTATVTAIDQATRQVTLVASDGSQKKVKAGPEVVNFDQLQVGDQIKVTVAKELVVSMAPNGVPSGDAAAAVLFVPTETKPGGTAADTVQVTAKVVAINLQGHKATLQMPDGTTATFAVRPDVDLTRQQVGESVVIRTTQAVAIAVEKPERETNHAK